MILEESAAEGPDRHQIVGGGQQIEDDEIHEEDEEDAEYLDNEARYN